MENVIRNNLRESIWSVQHSSGNLLNSQEIQKQSFGIVSKVRLLHAQAYNQEILDFAL